MTEIQMMRSRVTLARRRHELVRAIRAQTGELAIREGGHDPIDQLQSMNQRDEAALTVQWLSRVLSDVDAVLRAMPDGLYGARTECGEPISLKRLEAISWALHCAGCQEFMERREAAQAADRAWAVRFDEEQEAA
jgi:RNA polymerase-binding transcription factor DksA